MMKLQRRLAVLELKRGVGEREVGRGESVVGWWPTGGGGRGGGGGWGQGWGRGGGQGGGRWLRSNGGRGAVREERRRVNIMYKIYWLYLWSIIFNL